MIALIDYGAGNLTSVRKALSALGADFRTPTSPAECAEACGIIVPGVGHFASTSSLDDGWRDVIARRVQEGVPLLGICLGMQWLFEGSEEAPELRGLALLAGRCARLAGDATLRLKVPHVGWNVLEPRPSRLHPSALGNARWGPRLLAGIAAGAQVYFTHSYAAPVTADCVAETTHALPFAAAVERDNVFGVQFHPEKSGETGLRIVRNFLDVVQAHHRVS